AVAAQRRTIGAVAMKSQEVLPSVARRKAGEPAAAQILRHWFSLVPTEERRDLLIERRWHVGACQTQCLRKTGGLQVGKKNVAPKFRAVARRGHCGSAGQRPIGLQE